MVLWSGRPVQGGTYHSDALHFTLDLPEPWVVMTGDEITQINERMIRQLGPGEAVPNETGFRRAGTLPGTYPYITVQKRAVKTTGLSSEDVERILSGDNPAALKSKHGRLADLMEPAETKILIHDPKNNRFLMHFEVAAPGGGQVESVTVGHIGDEGLIHIYAFAPKTDFKDILPTFLQIHESFRFDPGHAFTPKAGPWGWENLLWVLLFVTLGVVALLSLGVYLFRVLAQHV
jgi:hypothetical protein